MFGRRRGPSPWRKSTEIKVRISFPFPDAAPSIIEQDDPLDLHWGQGVLAVDGFSTSGCRSRRLPQACAVARGALDAHVSFSAGPEVAGMSSGATATTSVLRQAALDIA